MQKYIHEARILLSLAIPVILTQVSQTAMGVVDTIMSGSFSATDMAAVAVGTSIWLPFILLGHGLLLPLTPIIAQLNGSRKHNLIFRQINQGLWVALITAIIIMIILYNSYYIIDQIHNVEQEMAEKAIAFLRCLLWGTPGYLFFQVLRCQCEGLSRTKPGMIIGFIGLMSNIPINYIFIHGKMGMPALGGVGCGIATASVYWIMFLALHIYMRKDHEFRKLYFSTKIQKPDLIVIKRLLTLGISVGLALFFEVTLFTLVALLLAPLGIIAIAGHQIALNFSSIIFVLPLSIGSAATIRVGFNLGEKKIDQAKISSWSSIIIGIILACSTAILTISLRKNIALLYNNTPSVVAIASHLMMLASIYQISDSIQVISNGILRGYKDTHSIFFITFISYWLIGLPFGYVLALTNWILPAMGPSGFWIGFIIGLTISAILMIYRINWLQKQKPKYILYRAAR